MWGVFHRVPYHHGREVASVFNSGRRKEREVICLRFCPTCGSRECLLTQGDCKASVLPPRGIFRTSELETLSESGVDFKSHGALWVRLEQIQRWSKNKIRQQGSHVLSTIFEDKNIRGLTDDEVLYAANLLKLPGTTISAMRLQLQKRARGGLITTALGDIPTDFPLVCDAEGLARLHVFDIQDQDWSKRFNTPCGFKLGNNKTCSGTLVLASQYRKVKP